jgi:hypothetical protein
MNILIKLASIVALIIAPFIAEPYDHTTAQHKMNQRAHEEQIIIESEESANGLS